MGFRYRKSIRLGGGFRINISGSGVGYSWGVPGYRITKTANGKIRQTVSIPGTGISYVSEESIRSAETPRLSKQPPAFETEVIQSTDRNSYKDADFAALMKQIHLVRFLNKASFIIGTVTTPVPRLDADKRSILGRRRPQPHHRSVEIQTEIGLLLLII